MGDTKYHSESEARLRESLTSDTDSKKFVEVSPMVQFTFFIFGISGWMAWNAALTGLDLYESRFKPYGHDPGFVFGFVFNWPLFLTNVLLLYLISRVSLSARVY